MIFLDLIINFFKTAKKLNFYGEKLGFQFCQDYEIQILVKDTIFV